MIGTGYRETQTTSSGFPAITVPGERVDAKQYVEPGTGLAMFGAILLGIVGTLLAILVSQGILLIVLPIALIIYPLTAWYFDKKATALIHGSGVHVNEHQFPEIYNCVQEFRARLNLQKDVDVYIIEENTANAFAVRYGKKNIVLLTDDLIHGCLVSGCPQALSFVIAHELAHIALNHNGLFRSWSRQHLKKLGRLDEYSSDSVAMALVGSPAIAFHGILLLTVGYALLRFVNPQSIARQAQEVASNKYSKKAERKRTHPLLLHRLRRTLNMR